MSPLLLTGLGVIVAWKAGMFNIGGEGQYVMGGLTGAWLAKILMIHNIDGADLLIAILIASIIGGGLYGLLAGWMKTSRGVDVVISTILLNFVAIQVLKWAVAGPLMEAQGGLPQTDELPASAMLWKPDPRTDLHAGILIGIICAILVWLFLYRTKRGFQLRVVGDNPLVARTNRVPVSRIQLLAMAISGALCGLAGGVEYTAIAGQVGTDFSQNWGFLGIPVAIIAGLHPLLILLSAFYFGAMIAGSVNLERFSTYGDTLIYVVQAAAVLGLVALQSIKTKRKIVAEVNE